MTFLRILIFILLFGFLIFEVVSFIKDIVKKKKSSKKINNKEVTKK